MWPPWETTWHFLKKVKHLAMRPLQASVSRRRTRPQTFTAALLTAGTGQGPRGHPRDGVSFGRQGNAALTRAASRTDVQTRRCGRRTHPKAERGASPLGTGTGTGNEELVDTNISKIF